MGPEGDKTAWGGGAAGEDPIPSRDVPSVAPRPRGTRTMSPPLPGLASDDLGLLAHGSGEGSVVAPPKPTRLPFPWQGSTLTTRSAAVPKSGCAAPTAHPPPSAEGEVPAPTGRQSPTDSAVPSAGAQHPTGAAQPPHPRHTGPAGNWDLLEHLPGHLGRGHGATEVGTWPRPLHRGPGPRRMDGWGATERMQMLCLFPVSSGALSPPLPSKAGGPWVPPLGRVQWTHRLRRTGGTLGR